MPSRLLGDPAQRWNIRFNLLSDRVFGRNAAAVFVAIIVSIWARTAAKMHPATHAWLAIQSTNCLGTLLWRHRAPHSFARHREWLAVAFRLFGAGFGAALLMLRGLMDEIEPAAAVSPNPLVVGARHAALLLQASSVPPMLLWWAAPLRFWLALPVQLIAVLNAMTWNQHVCGGRALADPAAQRLTGSTYSFLAMAHFTLLPAPASTLHPEQECAVVLAFLQLAVAVVLPALAQAAVESALFSDHQQQRQQAGLPPEGKLQARLYRWLNEMTVALDGPAAFVAVWVMLGMLWELAVLFMAGRPQAV